MKRSTLVIAAWLFVTIGYAQQARQDFKADRNLSASNYVAYPGPLQQTLSPAPADYVPCYISHYGRHGSRYLIGTNDYDRPYYTLMRADSLGKLTETGRDVLRRVRMIREEAQGRDGELTRRGAEQHKQIARRMFERFPQVFEGPANVDAKSTVVIRCILSMENALQQLILLNPQLHISHDASHHDMYYMNQTDRALKARKMTPEAKKSYDAFAARHANCTHLMGLIFNDATYWQHSIDARKLASQLYVLASNVQSTELRHSLTLYDLFTDDELYDAWLCTNAWWYINYGPSPLNGGTQPYSQRNLLRMIIHEADSCLQLPRCGATLRYGHDTMVMPLTCLLGINGYGRQITDLEQLDDAGWCDYRIFPMGSNLQFVFYRSPSRPDDIILKVLLNENETTLPVKTDIAPYYHWRDFRNYYLKKLDAYKAD